MKQKIGWIVSIRGLAAIAIVLLHVIGAWKGDNWGGYIDTRLILDEIVIQIVVRWAVPCFLMITGYLLLDKDKSISTKDILRYSSRILIVLITFGLLFCLIEAYIEGERGLSLGITSIINLFEGNSWSHMWYLYTLIGIYLLLPLFKRYTEGATLMEQETVLVVLIVFTIAIPTINQFIGRHFVTLLPVNSCYVVYILFGGLLRNYGRDIVDNRWILLIIGMVGFAVMLYLKILGYQVSYNPDNLFVCFYSIGLFTISCNSRWLEKASGNKILSAVSKYSFGIYIMHPIALNLLMKGFHIYPDSLPIGLGELTFWILAFTSGFIITWIITRIPICRRYLI